MEKIELSYIEQSASQVLNRIRAGALLHHMSQLISAGLDHMLT
jgi:hypothetical protein